MSEFVTFLSFPFVQRALVAGVILGLVGAVLGVFVVLRRMSFFSDAVAHASLAGIAIGLLLELHPTVGAILISVLLGVLMGALMKKRSLASDTIIGVLFSSSIALAIFILTVFPRSTVDLTSLLFGNILTTSLVDILLAVLLLLMVLLFAKFFTKPMLKLIFSQDVAEVEEKRLKFMEYAYPVLLAVTIAVSLKIVGAILVSALIIIPAATAQNVSANLRQMFVFSIVVGLVSVVLGLFLSYFFNSPSGSTIVLTATAFFLLSLFFRKS